MTAEQKYFISLSRAAIFDETPPPPPENVDWQYIWTKAKEQNLPGLLAGAIQKLPDEKKPENYEQWRLIMMQTALVMGSHFDEFDRMRGVLEQSGITPVCLKGIILKDLYPIPEMRVMGDFDIWIEPSRRKAAETIFENEGYRVERNTLFDAIEKDGVHWELFVSLEDDFRIEPKRWNGELKNNVYVNQEGLKILSPTYELAYTVIHAAKHLTREGCGLRNMLDVALVLKNRSCEIDLGKAFEICASQGYEQVFLYMLAVAVDWYGLKLDYGFELPGSGRFLEYLLSYGVFGRDVEGKVLAAQVVRREGDGVGPLRRIFFPPAKMIWHKYQYVKKSPLLLPVAWIHRFFNAVFVKKYSIRDMAAGLGDSLEYGNERESWLNELNIH